jgi:hypothetical protein
VLAISNEVLISRQIQSILELTLLTCYPLWHDETDTLPLSCSLLCSLSCSLSCSHQQYDCDALWHILWHTVWHFVSYIFPLPHSHQYVLSDTFSLTWSLWQNLSDILFLTGSCWSVLPHMVFLTCSLWHCNSPIYNDNLTRDNVSDNTWNLACVFPNQSAVHNAAHIRSWLRSNGLAVVYNRSSWNGGCNGIYCTAAIGFQYQNRVGFPYIYHRTLLPSAYKSIHFFQVRNELIELVGAIGIGVGYNKSLCEVVVEICFTNVGIHNRTTMLPLLGCSIQSEGVSLIIQKWMNLFFVIDTGYCMANTSVSDSWLRVSSSHHVMSSDSLLSSPSYLERLLEFGWRHLCVEGWWQVKLHHQAKTLHHRVLSCNGIVEHEKVVIECPQDNDHCDTPITCSNAVYSVYPNGTSMLA